MPTYLVLLALVTVTLGLQTTSFGQGTTLRVGVTTPAPTTRSPQRRFNYASRSSRIRRSRDSRPDRRLGSAIAGGETPPTAAL